MERAVPIDIDHQVVSELAEALTDDVVTSIVGLNRAEYKGYFLARRTDDSNPAVRFLEDGRPARAGSPERKEAVIRFVRRVRDGLLSNLLRTF